MSTGNPLAAEILETSTRGFALAASAQLAEMTAGSDLGLGVSSRDWTAHFVQRIQELAASLRVGEPLLFASKIEWLRQAYRARGVSDDTLRVSLESMRAAFAAELPSDLNHAVAEPLAMAFRVLSQEPAPDTADSAKLSDPLFALSMRYLEGCISGQVAGARQLILDAIDNGLDVADAITSVLLAAEREVGNLWHVGDVSIAQERLVSGTTADLLVTLADRYAPAPSEGALSVLSASVSGNAHDIGLRAAAVLFQLAGWRSLFLGADVPSKEIAAATVMLKADLVVLSASITTQLNELSVACAALRELDAPPKIIVGGPAFDTRTDLWQRLGADALSDSIHTVVARAGTLFS